MHDEAMRRIARWGKFVGIFTIISGVFSAIAGLPLFLVGAIPGVITVYAGYLLYQTGSNATTYVDGGLDVVVTDLLGNFSKYLLLQGILMILNIAIVVFVFLFAGFGTRKMLEMF